MCRHQKRKTDCQVKQLFALLGSVSVKAACGTLVKLTPGGAKNQKHVLGTLTGR